MFCGKCGNQLREGVKFCPKCGHALPTRTTVERTDTSAYMPPVPPAPQKKRSVLPVLLPVLAVVGLLLGGGLYWLLNGGLDSLPFGEGTSLSQQEEEEEEKIRPDREEEPAAEPEEPVSEAPEETPAAPEEEPTPGVPAEEPESPAETMELPAYAGTCWVSEGYGFRDGGYCLDFVIEEETDEVTVTFQRFGGQLTAWYASIYETVPLSEVENGWLTLTFEDDGWDNAGTLELVLGRDAVFYNVSLTEETSWGIHGSGALQNDPDAWSRFGQERFESVNLADGFDVTDQRIINVFLSNFSEQGFQSYHSATSDEDLYQFAFLYNYINTERLTRGTDSLSLPAQYMASTMTYFFGRTLPNPSRGTSVTSRIIYGDGEFIYQGTDVGGDFGYMTVVDRMFLREDGDYDVLFYVFAFSEELFASGNIYPCYDYDMEQARADNSLRLIYEGVAVLTDNVTANTEAPYHLREYEIFYH